MPICERRRPSPSVWKEKLLYAQRLGPEGKLGEFQREKNLSALKKLFQIGVARFSPQDQQLLLSTYDFTMRIHAGQPPRLTGADARTHLARVAIIGLFDRGTTKQSTAIRLLHDSIEDGVATQNSLITDLQHIGWQRKDALVIAEGAQVMSMYEGKRHLSHTVYESRIIAMNKRHRDLRLIELKRDDRADNTRDDCVRLMDTILNKRAWQSIHNYWQGKAQRAENLPKPFFWIVTPSHQRLREARRLCGDELKRTNPNTVVFNSRARG